MALQGGLLNGLKFVYTTMHKLFFSVIVYVIYPLTYLLKMCKTRTSLLYTYYFVVILSIAMCFSSSYIYDYIADNFTFLCYLPILTSNVSLVGYWCSNILFAGYVGDIINDSIVDSTIPSSKLNGAFSLDFKRNIPPRLALFSGMSKYVLGGIGLGTGVSSGVLLYIQESNIHKENMDLHMLAAQHPELAKDILTNKSQRTPLFGVRFGLWK